jgi:hypothetical protein
MSAVSDRAAASITEEPDEADRAAASGGSSPPRDSAVPSEQTTRLPVQPLPSSTQGTQLAPNEAQLRQEFERFLNERKQAPTEPQDRETLFGEFKKLIESMNAQANGSTRRVEIWRALETTNLRELASAASTVIGEVAKGSAFRVIGRSDDGKWLKIETPDGLTGYYWAVRAREMR